MNDQAGAGGREEIQATIESQVRSPPTVGSRAAVFCVGAAIALFACPYLLGMAVLAKRPAPITDPTELTFSVVAGLLIGLILALGWALTRWAFTLRRTRARTVLLITLSSVVLLVLVPGYGGVQINTIREANLVVTN